MGASGYSEESSLLKSLGWELRGVIMGKIASEFI
jgi:hypothetical protein